MPERYSPLRYPGGKAKLARFLREILKANGLVNPHYVEPYAGGAGAALHLLAEEFVSSITINDADPRIWALWRALLTRTDDFLGLIDKVPLTVKEWHRQRSIYQKRDLRRILELGFAAFYLNRTTRSGIMHNGGPIGGTDQTGNYKIDARFPRGELRRRVVRIASFADRIELSREDGLSLLKRISRSKVRAQNTFLYLDPPYYRKGAELYLNRFTHQQHKDLADFLRRPRGFPWVMTYDNVAEIRSLYAGLPQLCFDLAYSAYERRCGQELLIYPANVKVSTVARASLPSVA